MRTLHKLWFLTAGLVVLIVAASVTGIAQGAADKMRPLLVRDVEQTGRQSFRGAVSCLAEPGLRFCSEELSIPAGKRLVIETISASVEVPAGQLPRVECGLGAGLFTTFFLPLQKIFTASEDEYGGLAPVRLYVGPDEAILLSFMRDQLTGTALATLKVSGYLVDCGPGEGCPVPN